MNTGTTLPTGASDSNASKRAAHFLTPSVRIVIGLALIVSGLDGFMDDLPYLSTPVPDGGIARAGALLHTGYLVPFALGAQVFLGALLLSNRFVPLALVVIEHVFLKGFAFPDILPVPELGVAAVVVLEVYLAVTRGRMHPFLLAIHAACLERSAARNAGMPRT